MACTAPRSLRSNWLARAPRARALLVACALAGAPLVGCGASTTTPAPQPLATAGGEVADDPAVRVEVLETAAVRRDRRIRELESRLALADAEVRDLRHEVAQAEDRDASLAVVRIGDAHRVAAVAPEEDVEPAEPPQEEVDTGPRPVLRLYGEPSYELGSAPIASVDPGIARPMQAPAAYTGGAYLPAPPPGALGRLPVAAIGGSTGVPPIPVRPLTVMPQAPAPGPRRAADDSVVREYQAALGHVAGRRFDEALGALDAFLRAHPQHPYADNAMYWRGEVLYARRDYDAAERELAEMVRRFPQGNKVPDALLRLGFCRQRQGDVEGARTYFRRVRAEHPGTVAARLASREDT